MSRRCTHPRRLDLAHRPGKRKRLFDLYSLKAPFESPKVTLASHPEELRQSRMGWQQLQAQKTILLLRASRVMGTHLVFPCLRPASRRRLWLKADRHGLPSLFQNPCPQPILSTLDSSGSSTPELMYQRAFGIYWYTALAAVACNTWETIPILLSSPRLHQRHQR